MTLKQLESLTKLWQKRLRLQDWTINVKLVPFCEDGSVKTLGTTSVRTRWMEADIEIREQNHRDQEKTLVHELIHVLLPNSSVEFCTKTDNLYGEEIEIAIERISGALVEAYRDA